MKQILAAAVIFVAWVGWAAAATAAPLLSISYTVTGGTFSGNVHATGSVNGGTLTINTSATASTFFCSSFCGTASLVLTGTGPAALFSATWILHQMYITANYISLSAHVHNAGFSILTTAGAGPVGLLYSQTLDHAIVRASLGSGDGFVSGVFSGIGSGETNGTGDWLHSYTIGSEVRTFVPEPSSAPLAGLGLLALSGYAARRRVRRTARKA